MGGGAGQIVGRVTALALGPAAVADLEEIHDYFDAVEDGLGRRFVAALDELFARLGEFPRSAPLVADYIDVRRAVVRGFPYVVFYRHRPERIDVLRVLHAAREDADRPGP
ncbi:MAG: type II toxin-antitoxin system RelE/ParE family toxin [Nitriliruptoraceae bacterium]